MSACYRAIDKLRICVITQFRMAEYAIILDHLRNKTQLKIGVLNNNCNTCVPVKLLLKSTTFNGVTT